MAKTKPIGVRFDNELLDKLKERGVKNAQQALILYESAYKSEMGKVWEQGQKLIDAARGRDITDLPEKKIEGVYILMSDIEALKGIITKYTI